MRSWCATALPLQIWSLHCALTSCPLRCGLQALRERNDGATLAGESGSCWHPALGECDRLQRRRQESADPHRKKVRAAEATGSSTPAGAACSRQRCINHNHQGEHPEAAGSSGSCKR